MGDDTDRGLAQETPRDSPAGRVWAWQPPSCQDHGPGLLLLLNNSVYMFSRCAETASLSVVLTGTGSWLLPSPLGPEPHTHAWQCPLATSSLLILGMFSRNPQSFDYTPTVRHNVTFPAGGRPTWAQRLHMVFIFVLEKAPDTFGQSSSCWRVAGAISRPRHPGGAAGRRSRHVCPEEPGA